eukprot:1160269-Pelagomonas_calceolata.AAC.3
MAASACFPVHREGTRSFSLLHLSKSINLSEKPQNWKQKVTFARPSHGEIGDSASVTFAAGNRHVVTSARSSELDDIGIKLLRNPASECGPHPVKFQIQLFP